MDYKISSINFNCSKDKHPESSHQASSSNTVNKETAVSSEILRTSEYSPWEKPILAKWKEKISEYRLSHEKAKTENKQFDEDRDFYIYLKDCLYVNNFFDINDEAAMDACLNELTPNDESSDDVIAQYESIMNALSRIGAYQDIYGSKPPTCEQQRHKDIAEALAKLNLKWAKEYLNSRIKEVEDKYVHNISPKKTIKKSVIFSDTLDVRILVTQDSAIKR